jgi:hypothetical protein
MVATIFRTRLKTLTFKNKERKMKTYSKILMLVFICLFLTAGNAAATLIGVDLGLPIITSDSPGYYNYNADTNLFTSDAFSVQISFDGVTQILFVPRGIYHAGFYVDETGHFAGGTLGDDLYITGNFTYNSVNYSGLLLAGEVTNFGWEQASNGDLFFDFAFDVTGGQLASFFDNNVGGDISHNTSNDFTDWDHSSSGTRVKSETAPVSEPAAFLLFGSGILGLAFFMRRK